jgi:2-methylisocitrate lyase-like PEP mutase family enzyme
MSRYQRGPDTVHAGLRRASAVDTVETIIAAAPNVLWLADGDTGYGNALAVQKTIGAYARRGADTERDAQEFLAEIGDVVVN